MVFPTIRCDVILTVYQESKSVPSEEILHRTVRKVLLTPEEVKFWFEHLHQIHQNRKRGAKKAAETRKRKAKEKELKTYRSKGIVTCNKQWMKEMRTG